jgi:hypothetical protein
LSFGLKGERSATKKTLLCVTNPKNWQKRFYQTQFFDFNTFTN